MSIYHLVGPILAIGLVTVTAFRFRSRHRHVGAYGGAAGVTVGLAGAACLLMASILPIVMPERSSSWVVGLILQVVGVLALGAAMMIATSRRRRPAVEDVDDFEFPTDDLDRVEFFEREVTAEARQLRQTSRRWGATNYVLGFLTATLSGAAGVTGISSAEPSSVELVFAVLAIVGAGLAALNTSLGAAQAQKEAKVKAMALESLSRNIRWAPRERTVARIDEYVDHLNRVTGPDWPPANSERPVGNADGGPLNSGSIK